MLSSLVYLLTLSVSPCLHSPSISDGPEARGRAEFSSKNHFGNSCGVKTQPDEDAYVKLIMILHSDNILYLN